MSRGVPGGTGTGKGREGKTEEIERSMAQPASTPSHRPSPTQGGRRARRAWGLWETLALCSCVSVNLKPSSNRVYLKTVFYYMQREKLSP